MQIWHAWNICVVCLLLQPAGAAWHHQQARHHALGWDHTHHPLDQDMDKRVRSQWMVLTTACPRRNFSSCESIDRSGWTDGPMSSFSKLSFKGLGQWSTFTMSTYAKNGAKKTAGGDSWFLLLRDYNQRLRLPIRIFDNNDGTYTGAVHFLHPGNYTLVGWLYYSDCHGLQVGFHTNHQNTLLKPLAPGLQMIRTYPHDF